jgi:hypothetical protein
MVAYPVGFWECVKVIVGWPWFSRRKWSGK